MNPKLVSNIELRLDSFEGCHIMKNTLELSDVTSCAELCLYQFGYLTIKKYDEFGYTLGFPNVEAKQALKRALSPYHQHDSQCHWTKS